MINNSKSIVWIGGFPELRNVPPKLARENVASVIRYESVYEALGLKFSPELIVLEDLAKLGGIYLPRDVSLNDFSADCYAISRLRQCCPGSSILLARFGSSDENFVRQYLNAGVIGVIDVASEGFEVGRIRLEEAIKQNLNL